MKSSVSFEWDTMNDGFSVKPWTGTGSIEYRPPWVWDGDRSLLPYVLSRSHATAYQLSNQTSHHNLRREYHINSYHIHHIHTSFQMISSLYIHIISSLMISIVVASAPRRLSGGGGLAPDIRNMEGLGLPQSARATGLESAHQTASCYGGNIGFIVDHSWFE